MRARRRLKSARHAATNDFDARQSYRAAMGLFRARGISSCQPHATEEPRRVLVNANAHARSLSSRRNGLSRFSARREPKLRHICPYGAESQ